MVYVPALGLDGNEHDARIQYNASPLIETNAFLYIVPDK